MRKSIMACFIININVPSDISDIWFHAPKDYLAFQFCLLWAYLMKVSYSRNAAWVLNSISTLLCIFHFCVQIVIN